MDHVIKFVIVGGTSFILNSILLIAGVRYLKMVPSIAGALGAEICIVFNFVANNFFTFSDRPLTSWSVIPEKFLTFNLFSFGGLLIQYASLKIGEHIFGLERVKRPLLEVMNMETWPIVGGLIGLFLRFSPLRRLLSEKLTVYYFFFMLGVGVAMVFNFVIYSTIIWKTQ